MRIAHPHMTLTRLLAFRLLLPLLLAGTGLFATGCAKGTFLEVRVTAPAVLPDVYGLRMALSLTPAAGGSTVHATDVIRDNGKPIKFPATMAFSLDDEMGALQIDATALNEAGLPVGSGTATTTVMHAKTWVIPVMLGLP